MDTANHQTASPAPEAQPRMRTFSGRMVLPLNVRTGEIEIQDIAHALALTVRYGGHCPFFYSVAQHSLLVAQVLPDGLKLWGLLHDGAEAYLGDIIHPLKVHFKDYHLAEDVLMKRIAKKYGLCWPEPPEVKAADLAVGATECAQFGIPVNARREAQPIAALLPIFETSWRAAEHEFLYEFTKLTRGQS